MRLIPPAPPATILDALRTLLAHRLPSGIDGEQAAREEWRTIVEGKSTLWVGIPEDRKEIIRGTMSGLLVRSFSCSYVVAPQVFQVVREPVGPALKNNQGGGRASPRQCARC